MNATVSPPPLPGTGKDRSKVVWIVCLIVAGALAAAFLLAAILVFLAFSLKHRDAARAQEMHRAEVARVEQERRRAEFALRRAAPKLIRVVPDPEKAAVFGIEPQVIEEAVARIRGGRPDSEAVLRDLCGATLEVDGQRVRLADVATIAMEPRPRAGDE